MSAPWRQLSPRMIELSNAVRSRVAMNNQFPFLNRAVLDQILLHAIEIGASDVDFFNDQPVWLQVEGYRHPINHRSFSTSELRHIADTIYGGSASTILAQGKSVNPSYEVRVDRTRNERFRVNIVQHDADGGAGLQITMRHIPREIPRLEKLNIEPELIVNLMSDKGMMAITGPTGSGKSTLMASIVQEDLLDPMAHRKYLFGEQPIEFLLRKIPGATTLVSQMEIGRDIPSFEAFVEEAMRRKPEVIVVGECKNRATMAASIDASNSGHFTCTTMHTKTVAETVRRAINFFPADERDGAALDFIGNARVIVNQILVPGADGKRRAAREFLVFTPEVRELMSETPLSLWPEKLRKITAEQGQPMSVALRRLVETGEVLPDMIPQFTQLREAA